MEAKNGNINCNTFWVYDERIFRSSIKHKDELYLPIHSMLSPVPFHHPQTKNPINLIKKVAKAKKSLIRLC